MIKTQYNEIGVCGLSCRLCPRFHTEGPTRCMGCKSKNRMAAGCPFITCALKKKGVELCNDCKDNKICALWKQHRETGKKHDSFKCYQCLEKDIKYLAENGVDAFEGAQIDREKILRMMIREFDEGSSKTYYCIAATVLEIDELKEVMAEAKKNYKRMDLDERSELLHSLLEEVSVAKKYCLKLRK